MGFSLQCKGSLYLTGSVFRTIPGGRNGGGGGGAVLKTMREWMVSSGNLVAEDKWICGRRMVSRENGKNDTAPTEVYVIQQVKLRSPCSPCCRQQFAPPPYNPLANT